MARKYHFNLGEYYHVYNRGVEKREIFLREADYRRFQFLLYICNNTESIKVRDHISLSRSEKYALKRKDELVNISCYSLMPNHFHLLLKEVVEGGISRFMQKITTAYTMYFNEINSRSGVLFQGSFKAQHINNDNYLKYLNSYIHLNPLKLVDKNWKDQGLKDIGKAKKYLASYNYSSYLDVIKADNRPEKVILNPESFPKYFEDKEKMEDFLTDWMTYNEFEADLHTG